jgi:hypothetical protein
VKNVLEVDAALDLPLDERAAPEIQYNYSAAKDVYR